MLLTLWSTSAGVVAIINTLNKAYDIEESRPWWKVRLTAIGLTIGLALFILVSFVLVVVGPQLAEKVAEWFGLDRCSSGRGGSSSGPWYSRWWPPASGSSITSLPTPSRTSCGSHRDPCWRLSCGCSSRSGFKFYVTNFADYNETYGAIGGVIVLLLWFTERSGHPDRRRDERGDRARLSVREGSWREGGGGEENRDARVRHGASARRRANRSARRPSRPGRPHRPPTWLPPGRARWCWAASSPVPSSSSGDDGG